MSFGIPVRNGLGLGLLASTSLSTVNGSPFSPLSLFASGEPGGWYDPSDLTTLFQDSAGTTPVTAVEQPVGLMLDKSRGLVLGSELVVNGDGGTFSSSITGVISVGSATLSRDTVIEPNGCLKAVSTTTGNTPKGAEVQTFTAVVGRTYKISGRVYAPSSNSTTRLAAISCIPTGGTATQAFGATVADTWQTVSFYFVATATTHSIYAWVLWPGIAWGTTGDTAYFDDISVKELAGAHLTQSTSTARPVLSARVNLLTYTEQFDNAVWNKLQATVSANTSGTTDPLGGNTADKLVEGSGSVFPIIFYDPAVSITTAVVYKYSLYVKSAGRNIVGLYVQLAPFPDNGRTAWFNLSDQTTQVQSGVVASITSAGNGWYQCSMTVTADATNSSTGNSVGCFIANAMGGTSAYTGDGTSGLYIWGADLRVANDTATPVYQRVGVGTPGSSTGAGSSDYTVTGFPLYLYFAGVDDFMVSPTITPGIDKAQVFAGVRKLSDAAIGIVAELGADAFTNAGGIFMTAPQDTTTSGNFGFWSRGSIQPGSIPARSATIPAPTSVVLTGIGDISGDLASVRTNGTVGTDNTANQGTGNYVANPLYVGRRGGTTLPYNGRLYPLIVRFGANLTDTQIAQTESYVSTQMGGGYVPVGYDFLVDANGDQLTDASGNALYTIPLYS